MSEETLFRCPTTQQELKTASKQRIRAINKKIEAGTLLNLEGTRVIKPIDGGYERADKTLLYPTRDGIPNFMLPDSIPL